MKSVKVPAVSIRVDALSSAMVMGRRKLRGWPTCSEGVLRCMVAISDSMRLEGERY